MGDLSIFLCLFQFFFRVLTNILFSTVCFNPNIIYAINPCSEICSFSYLSLWFSIFCVWEMFPFIYLFVYLFIALFFCIWYCVLPHHWLYLSAVGVILKIFCVQWYMRSYPLQITFLVFPYLFKYPWPFPFLIAIVSTLRIMFKIYVYLFFPLF